MARRSYRSYGYSYNAYVAPVAVETVPASIGQATLQKLFANADEYFRFEQSHGGKLEYNTGNLTIMNGVSFEHNETTLTLALLLKGQLKGNAKWKLAIDSVKVKTPDGNFFYPDLMVCHPNKDKYFSEEPVVLVEVLSAETRKKDLVDKFLEYQKITTLQHYLCVEPERQLVLSYRKESDGTWNTDSFTKDEESIDLSVIGATITLKQIYRPD